MRNTIRFGAAALAVVLGLGLTACGSGTDTAATTTSAPSTSAATPTVPASSSDTPVPGTMMSGGMKSPETSAAPAATADHNATDLMFAQQMIVHHQGAIEMAALAPDRAQNPQVKDLAVRIAAAQAPEIDQMTSWLTLWADGMGMSGQASDSDEGMGGMDHGGMGSADDSAGATTGMSMPGMSMPGMMSDEQMQQLTAATGTAFDRLFLELMIEHHQGAIEMADTELAQGSNAAALALAQSIKTSQAAEIAEMQQLLESL